MRKLIRLSSMPYKNEDISGYKPITAGHNQISVDPHERFIAKRIPKTVKIGYLDTDPETGRDKVVYKDLDKTHTMLREAQREESASNIAKMVGFNIPETIIHSHEPDEHVTVLSRYLKGSKPLTIHPSGSLPHQVSHEHTILSELNPDSIVGSSIFNYVLNHRDAHSNNFLIHDKQLVPIDFGASFEDSHDEPTYVKGPNILDQSYLRFNKNKPLNKNLLEKYVTNKRGIIEEALKVSKLYPEDLRDHVLSTLARRLERIERLYNKDNPIIEDLRSVLGTNEYRPNELDWSQEKTEVNHK